MGRTNPQKKSELGQVQLAHRTVETNAQIQQVLSVIATLSGSLSHLQRDSESRDLSSMTEGQLALEKTLWSACERMQSLMNEGERWDNSFQRKIEREYEDLHKLQVDTFTAQKKAAEEVVSPHFQYRPALHRLRDGGWMAILGDIEQLEFAVFGIGSSAQAALDEFDAVFRRGIPASVEAYCDARKKHLEEGTPCPHYPNQEKTNERNDKLDTTGTGQGEAAPQ